VSLLISSAAVSDLTSRLNLDLGTDTGVLVFNAIPGGSAASAGIRGADRQVRAGNYIVPIGGDIIKEIEGRAIRSNTDITAALERHRPGDEVSVTIVRGRQPMSLDVELQEEPPIR
jgi:S1-C subfamily serine protease